MKHFSGARIFSHVALLCYALVLSTVAAVPIGTAFQVDYNCRQDQAQLTSFWTEAAALTTAAIRHLNAISSTAANMANERSQAERAATMWLAIETNADVQTALGVYGRVQAFLNNGPQAPFPTNPAKLFCSSAWLVQKAWTDAAIQPNGQPIPVPQPDGTTRNKQIQEEYPAQFARGGVVPFYSTNITMYLFEKPGDYCSSPSGLGATQDQTPGWATMTLCPRSFQVLAGFAPAASLGNVAQPVPNNLGGLQNYSPPSLTLFHELFHLVLGTADGQSDDQPLNPGGQAAYGAEKMVKLAQGGVGRRGDPTVKANVLKNPESYSWFALSAWWFYNGQPNTFFSNTGAVNRVPN